MRLRTLTAGLLAAAALAALPASALAGFVNETIRVSDDADDNLFPTSTVDAAGRTTVVWQEDIAGQRHLVARRVNPDATLGPRLVISDGTMIPVQYDVSSTAAGRTIVVWSESTNGTAPRFARGRWIEADDTLAPQFLVRNAGIGINGTESPVVAATSTGNAVVAWRNDQSTPPYQLQARLVSAAGLLAPLNLPTEGPGQSVPEVAANASGGALIAWLGSGGIWAMPIDLTGTAGVVQNPVAAGATGSLAMAGDGQDRFDIVWNPSAGADTTATLRLGPAGTATGTLQSLDTLGPADFPRVTTGPDGRSLAMWRRAGSLIVARLIDAGGTPAADALALPADGEAQFMEAAGLLSDGTGIALWTQGPPGSPRTLRARVIDRQGVAGPAETLAPGNGGSASVQRTGAGAGLVVWEQRDGGGTGPRAVVARRFAPPPTCAAAQATVVQGRPADIALSCAGLGLSGTQILSGPARGTLQPVGPTTYRYTPRPGVDGADSFTFRGLGAGGAGAVATATVSVGRDTVAPAIRRFALTRRVIPLATAFRVRPARRPAFVIRVGERATLAVTVQRRVGKRWRNVGVLRRKAATTAATLRLGRKVGTRALRPGRHRARLRATDLAGNRSGIRTVTFRVSAR